LSFGELCFLDTNGVFQKADANASATIDNLLCLALNNYDTSASGYFLLSGTIYDTSWAYTKGAEIYADTLAGGQGEQAPGGADIAKVIGYGDSTTLFFNPQVLNSSDAVVDTSGTPVDNDYAKFTNGTNIEGRSYAEVKQDLDLEIGTDVLAEQTIGIADDNLLEVDGSPNDDEFAKFTANGLEGRTSKETIDDLAYYLYAVKTQPDTINNDNVFSDDSELFIAVEANAYYRFHGIMMFNSHATPDIQYKFTLPSGATLQWTYDLDNMASYIRSVAESAFAAGDGTNRMSNLVGIINVDSTAGDFQLQWRQAASDANDTILLEGSCLQVWKLD
jgi:hypothetical protein